MRPLIDEDQSQVMHALAMFALTTHRTGTSEEEARACSEAARASLRMAARIRELEAENARLREAGDVLEEAMPLGTKERASAIRVWREAKRGTHG